MWEVTPRKLWSAVPEGHARAFKAKPFPPLEGSRIDQSTPFASTGIDHFGTLFYKERDGTAVKSFAVIFSCMATRLIHLELCEHRNVNDLLMAISRFVARRGCPLRFVSDNSTVFGLVKTLLEHVTIEELLELVAKNESPGASTSRPVRGKEDITRGSVLKMPSGTTWQERSFLSRS